MNKKLILLIASACILLGIVAVIMYKNNTFEAKIKNGYGFYDVKKIPSSWNQTYELILNDSDLKKYYGTKSGEEYMNSVIPEIILQINRDEVATDAIIKEAEKNGSKEFSITLQIRERDEFGDSSARKYIGRYISESYPAEEWFTEENKRIQKWTEYIQNEETAHQRGEEIGTYTLADMEEMVAKNQDQSINKLSDSNE